MPGIVGIISPPKHEALDICLENMISPVMYKNWYKVERKIVSGLGIANISLNNEPTFSEKDSQILTITGEIFDQEHLREKLLRAGVKDAIQCSLSDVLLNLYIKFGPEILCGLNGIYVITIWDDKTETLTIINDRYGLKKLCYWFSKEILLFASESKSITWHPKFKKKINELAICDFLQAGYILDNRTFFEDIKLVPPASIMTYQAGQLSFHQYWDFEFDTINNKTSKEDHYIDEYFHLIEKAVKKRVKKAVKRRANGKICLPISGGKDSRTLAGILGQIAREKELEVKTNTIGHEHCYDVQFGRKIAQRLGFDHTFIPIGPTYIAEYANEGVWRLEGAAACHTFWIFSQARFLEKNRYDFVMDGFLGDVLSGAWFEGPLQERDEGKVLKLLYHRYYNTVFRQDEVSRYLKPGIYKNVKDETFNSIKRCFNAAEANHIFNKWDYVDLRQRQRRYTALHLDILGAFSRVLNPFTDNELVDFMLGVPVEYRIKQRIYKKMIVKHLPRVARIPLADNGLPINALVMRYGVYRPWNLFYTWNYLYGSLLPRMTSAKMGHDLTSYAHYNEWLRTGSKTFAINVLSQTEYLEDYFNMDTVNDLVTEHMEGRIDASKKICTLITFSLFRKQFC